MGVAVATRSEGTQELEGEGLPRCTFFFKEENRRSRLCAFLPQTFASVMSARELTGALYDAAFGEGSFDERVRSPAAVAYGPEVDVESLPFSEWMWLGGRGADFWLSGLERCPE